MFSLVIAGALACPPQLLQSQVFQSQQFVLVPQITYQLQTQVVQQAVYSQNFSVLQQDACPSGHCGRSSFGGFDFSRGRSAGGFDFGDRGRGRERIRESTKERSKVRVRVR